MNLKRDDLLSQLRGMDGHEFEELVADIWEQRGWETTVTTGSGDDGIDVIAEKSGAISEKHVIQAKCYAKSSKIGPSDIRDFNTGIELEGNVDVGIFVTTSSFTSEAKKTAKRVNVKLVNGRSLCEIVLALNSQQFLSNYLHTELTFKRTDVSNLKTKAQEIETAFSDLLDIEINLLERMPAPEYGDEVRPNSEFTVEMSDWADKTVRNGFEFFALDRNLPDYFEESEGSDNLTSRVLEKDLSVRQVIGVLAENGDLQKAGNEIHQNRTESDPDTATILAYVFLKYSLRWDAEKGAITEASEQDGAGTVVSQPVEQDIENTQSSKSINPDDTGSTRSQSLDEDTESEPDIEYTSDESDIEYQTTDSQKLTHENHINILSIHLEQNEEKYAFLNYFFEKEDSIDRYLQISGPNYNLTALSEEEIKTAKSHSQQKPLKIESTVGDDSLMLSEIHDNRVTPKHMAPVAEELLNDVYDTGIEDIVAIETYAEDYSEVWEWTED